MIDREAQPDRKRCRVVSLDVDVCNRAAAIESTERMAASGRGGYVCFGTVHMVMESYDDPGFAAKVNGADMIVTDGMPLVWMQRLQGAKGASRIRANDLMVSLLGHAEKQGMRVGFYGGRQGVIDAILEKAGGEFPGLEIAYAYSPPFRPLKNEESERVVSEINASGTQILFMGLGCPKQENWMAAHRNELSCVMLGVGASFDFYAGNVRESPTWLGRLGLEWLYRLFQEPKRLWRRYLILNPRFIGLAARQILGRKGR